MSEELVEYKGKQLSPGRIIFNKCLPEDYPVIDCAVDGNVLNKILNDIAMKYSPEIVMHTLDNIKKLGFTYSTITGFTLSLEDLYSKDLEKIANDLTGDKSIDMPLMESEEIMSLLKTMPYATFVESGARGSWDQVKQLVLARGYVADANNRIRDNLIRSSLVSGLTQREFFDSSWGARKGLLDTAT